MPIVHYRHRRPKPERRAEPVKIANAVVTARKPKRYQISLDPPTPDPEAEASVRAFFERMGLKPPD